MIVLVIDGQGGGIGKSLVEKLCPLLSENHRIWALGTNSLATLAMKKAGAHEGATGENAIVHNAPKAGVIVGAMGILAANSMLGELTPAMARAIAESPAVKVLIPLSRCGIMVAGIEASKPVSGLITDGVEQVRRLCADEDAAGGKRGED